MKGRHLKGSLRVKEKKDYEAEIRLLKENNALLRNAIASASAEVQRLRIILELNGIQYEKSDS